LNLLKYNSNTTTAGMHELITYSGNRLDYETVNELLTKFGHESKKLGLSLPLLKKSYSVADEVIENIRYHADDISPNKINIRIYIQDNELKIEAENLASPYKAIKAREKAEYLRFCSKEEIKSIFKEKITTLPPEHSKGAGLGLIIIAKKSNSIEYECQKHDKNSFLLKQKITINSKSLCL